MQLVDIILHLDQYLVDWSQMMGPWLYLLLFTIIFCETGLVILPFLPGDSLLFAAGALAALPGSPLHIGVLWVLLISAAFLGDNLNYYIGQWIGPKAFSQEKSPWLNPKHLKKTQDFYARYGAVAVTLGRFAPIIRTFVPFVAGVGRMDYRKFWRHSLLGSVAWMTLFLGAGFLFGNLPFVKKNFHYVILAVIALSLMPMVIGAMKRSNAPENKQ